MIDSIDNNTAAPSGEADFSGAVSPEAEISSAAPAQSEPLHGLLGEDGGFVPDWYARFDELKGMEKSLSKFKTPEALAKSYAELERMRHYPGVENEEQMERFRRMAGLPESEEEYRLERPESTPENEWNAGLAERMARTAYRYGVPPEAMNALQETMSQAYEEAREQVEDSRLEMETRAEQSLQQEWGANYERNMGRATAALQRLASETGVDADALLDHPELGSNPDVIRLLFQASRLLDEAPLHHSGNGTPSPAEEAMRMESDPSHPLYDAYMSVNHPNHRYANELYDRLTSR